MFWRISPRLEPISMWFLVIFYNLFNNYYFLRPNVFWAGGRWWVMIDAWSWQEAWFCTAPVPSHDISHKTRLWLKTSCLKRSFICQRTKSVSCHVCKDICWKTLKVILFLRLAIKSCYLSQKVSKYAEYPDIYLKTLFLYHCFPRARHVGLAAGAEEPREALPRPDRLEHLPAALHHHRHGLPRLQPLGDREAVRGQPHRLRSHQGYSGGENGF